MSESGTNSLDNPDTHTKIRGDADDVRMMMLILISEAIRNSNAVIRQEFRKRRFQMIDDIEELHPDVLSEEKGRISLSYDDTRTGLNVGMRWAVREMQNDIAGLRSC